MIADKHRYLTSQGYIVSRAKITPEEDKMIKKDLIVKPRSIMQYEAAQPEYPIYFYNDKYYYLPKYYGISKFGPHIKNKINIGDSIKAKIKIEPLPFQYVSDNILKNAFDLSKFPDGNGGILSLPCGYGKCHGYNTEILMHNDTIKYVQDIVPGDIIMGDDYTERIVLSCTVGYGQLYLIMPDNPRLSQYVVNVDHILSLKNKKGQVININVLTYLIILNKYGYELFGYTADDVRFYIKIIKIPNGFYYGFHITGNRLYQLGDKQVTHNTYLSLRTACNLKLKTMIIVSKEFLRDQWIDAICKFTDATYGILQKKKIELDKDICIAMIHTLCLKTFSPDTFSSFGFLVIDECHHLASEMFVKSLFKIRPRFILGLSATPSRPDGLSHVFHKFIGDIMHTEKRTGINNVIIKKIIISGDMIPEINCYVTKYTKSGTKNTVEMTTDLSECMPRNLIILEIIKTLISVGRTILVLSSRRNHLTIIHNLIAGLHKSDGSPVTYGFYYGNLGTSPKEHKKMLEATSKCDIILGTEHIAKEGLDIPSLNTLIFATPPGVQIEQSVGRILRKYHEQFPPLVIDLVDKVGNYCAHSRIRDEWYTSEEYSIHILKMMLSDSSKVKKFILDNDNNNITKQKIKINKDKLFTECLL